MILWYSREHCRNAMFFLVKNMRKITKLMINKWNMTDTDWMGYKLQRYDVFNYHHLTKKVDGGKSTIDNGAILCSETSHPYLHLIESKDLELYMYLNNILKIINYQRAMPTREQLILIDNLLKQFEREHCSDITKKGEFLIKKEYIMR